MFTFCFFSCQATGTLCFGLGNKWLAVAGLAVTFISDQLGFSYVNEVIATSAPKAKRGSIMTLSFFSFHVAQFSAGFFGPALWELNKGLPFIACGGVLLAWCLLLWVLFYRRAIEMAPKGASGPVSAFKRFAAGKPWHQYQQEYDLNKEEDEAYAIYNAGGAVDPSRAVLILRGTVDMLQEALLDQKEMIMLQDRKIEELYGRANANAANSSNSSSGNGRGGQELSPLARPVLTTPIAASLRQRKLLERPSSNMLFPSGTEGISRNRSSYNNANPRHTIAYDLEIPRLLSSVQESKQSSEI